jgi:dTDP-4-amino-4,6-dideoxygalactose transaminase
MKSLDGYIADIKARRPFASTKINHGFWERLVVCERLRNEGINDPVELDRISGEAPYLFETGFHDELLQLLNRLPSMRGKIDFSASPYAFAACRRIEGTPAVGLAATNAVIERAVPAQFRNSDSLTWKNSVSDGSLVNFFHSLRLRNVVLIGPRWLDRFGLFAGIERFQHIEIDPRGARQMRHSFLREVEEAHQPAEDTVYLIQAGTYATWLVLKLQESLDRATLIDPGIVLDLCYLPQIEQRNWARAARHDVVTSIIATNPHWPDHSLFFVPNLPVENRSKQWHLFRYGILPEVSELTGLPARTDTDGLDRPSFEFRPVQFVEDKKIDENRLNEIMSLSRLMNHWTNFGPVSRALELVLARLLAIPPTRTCVVCASGTVALTTLAGLNAVKSQRPIRWVSSAFSYFALASGPFAESTIYVDCDEAGFLDLDAVKRLPESEWDGLIVTNLFGLKSDLDGYRRFAAERGKVLIVDGAAALLGVDRSSPEGIDEAISLHHTKPWGFGEGGCVIVATEDADVVRSILNVGIGGPPAVRRYALNGKMSDVAAAAILERIERLPNWQFYYNRQRRRIETIAKLAGLTILGSPREDAIVGSVPTLAPAAVAIGDFSNEQFTVRKYYQPLVRGLPRAEAIYSRLVNIPCHPGMTSVPTDTLHGFCMTIAKINSEAKIES